MGKKKNELYAMAADCPNYYECDQEDCEYDDEMNSDNIILSEKAKDAAVLAEELGLK